MSRQNDPEADNSRPRKERLGAIMSGKGLDKELVAAALEKSVRQISRYLQHDSPSAPSEAELFTLEEKTKCLRVTDSALQKELALGLADPKELRGVEDPRSRDSSRGAPEWAMERIRELEMENTRLRAQVEILQDTIRNEIGGGPGGPAMGFTRTERAEETEG